MLSVPVTALGISLRFFIRLVFAPLPCYVNSVVPRKKINLNAVRACLDRVCAKCGFRITPDKIVRVDWERQRCPACGEVFEASRQNRPSGTDAAQRSE